MLAKLKDKETWRRYFGSLKFALYCTTHPLDGYWDLTHEKRGTIAAANTILVLTLITRILKLQYTSFIFNQVYWPKVNIFLYLAGILFPLALWCVGNWGLTTLFDGKGTLRQVYMATCYGMAPYPLIQLPMILFSNVITSDEGAFYTVLCTLSLIWAVLLIISDTDSRIQAWQDDSFHICNIAVNACHGFHTAPVFQYDKSGNSLLCISCKRNNV